MIIVEVRMEVPEGLIRMVREVERIVVLTGAGISKESGIPTFREAQTGLWARYDPMQLATPGAFRKDPKLVWEWYEWRRGLVRSSEPHAGHLALVEMEKRVPDLTVITQNVDGFHRLAGSRNVIELHGNILRNKCFDEGIVVEEWEEDGEIPPRCPNCGGRIRPDVVWFGESLPVGALEEAYKLSQGAEIFFSVGTSGMVQPAASLPMAAFDAGAVVVEVNPDETPISRAAKFNLRGPAGEVLPELVRQVWEV